MIGIVMGSDSDLAVMGGAVEVCQQFEAPFELTVVSAHRTPERLLDYGKTALGRGLRVIIAGAGGAAHLPGMLASVTPLPVIGVPILSSNSIDGWDSVLSSLQRPTRVHVATVALNGAKNAALLALRILAGGDKQRQKQLLAHQDEMRRTVLEKALALKKDYPCEY